jgi:alpha-ribazole phosphatase/probable phosphoglycerate mutase
MLLYLIRHGETAWNADGRFQGQRNTPLSETGRAQAGVVARALASRHFDALYASDLARAAETADIVAAPHRLSPIHDLRLREVSFGEWEGMSLPEVTERWPEAIAAWRADSLRTRPPGGETLESVLQRVADFTEELTRQHPNSDLCIVGHGGSLRAMVAHALGADLSIYRALRLDNCSISIIKVSDGRPSLLLFNDVCHLEQQISAAPRTA